jgi:hypothetical protein
MGKGEKKMEKSAETNIDENVIDESLVEVAETLDEKETSDAVFKDTEKSEKEEPKKEVKEEPKKDVKEEKQEQSKEINSEFARRRRERELQEKIKKAKEEAIIEALGGINPYTQQEIKDSYDIQEYLNMKAIEKEGGDPLTDYASYQKEKLRREEEQRKQDLWFEKDREDFLEKYPNVDIQSLFADEAFIKFSSYKVGNTPMSKIYEDFIEITSAFEERASKKAQQMVANANSSTGSLKSNQSNQDVIYTREQVAQMTQEEVSKNYEKIRKSMAKW